MGHRDEPSEAAGGGSATLFRPDVEGLRGVAILLVLLFHGAFAVPGGFIGVDVFLVISGFLITGLLLRELETSGRIGLLAFYGRRMRRLLPAAAVVIAVVMPLAFVALPPLDRPGAMTDGAAAVLCASNIRSALAEGDYFAAVTTPSPFLHFWSLSLEEQFYLVWPFLLLLVARGRRVRLMAGAALLVLLVASLAASVVLTDRAATWGFYSLPSRSWQFAAGGLIAVGATLLRRLPDLPVAVAGWAGIAGIAVAAVAIDGSVPYPGAIALLPTAAAVLVIVAGDRARGPGILLRARPLRFLGRISYSLYLWHWPILVLPVAAAGVALGPLETAALTGVAIVVAWLSWALIEEPFRKAHGPRRTMTRLSLQLGTAAIVGVVTWSAMLGVSADAAIAVDRSGPASSTADIELDEGPASVDGADEPSDGEASETAGESGAASASGGPAAETAEAPTTTAATGTASTTPGTTSQPAPPTAPASAPPSPGLIAWTEIPKVRLPEGVRLPRDVRPALADARGDRERLPDDGCFTWLDGTVPADCVYGKANGKVTVALIGDSHAGHWFPAFNVLARRHGWRLLPYVKASCPFIDIPVYHPFAKREYTECATWRARAIKAINRERPDLVVVATAYRGIRPVEAADGAVRTQGEAMAREIDKIDAPVAIIVDSPRTSVDIPACLSSHPRDVNACAIPRGVAFFDTFGVRERVAAKRSGAAVVDVVAAVCPSTPCPVVIDGMIVYRDGHHLTATFVRSLAGDFDAALRPLLEPPPRPSPTAAAPSPVAPSLAAPSPILVSAFGAAPSATPAAATIPRVPASPAPPAASVPSSPPSTALVSRADVGPASRGAGGLEPVIATHPTDAARMMVAYQRRLATPQCSGAVVEAALAISRDGGRTWRPTRTRPWDGTGRASSYHSAVAWGPGPKAGSARLFWAGTTTRRCGGDLRVAVAWSDDEGATWSRLRVMTETPAWVGGMPDITVDRDPDSPRFGTVWLAYNFPLGGGLGSGVRVVASADHGRTWRGIGLARAAAPGGFPATWRFGYRIRTAPDGSALVSWYQADLHRWRPDQVFERGTRDNVGRIGFAVARVTLSGSHVRAGRPVLATTISRNAWTLGDRPAPGTRAHTYVDPMWSHGLAVDPVTGAAYLAVADYAPGAGGSPAGSVRVGRSTDGGRTWTWTEVRSPARAGGRAQSVFRPGVVARGGVVVVGMRTIDELGGASGVARIGAAWAVSIDGGRTFTRPALVPGSRWRSSVLAGAINGPGTRDRLDIAADGTAVYAYGVGRDAATSSIGAPGTVQVALIRVPTSSSPGAVTPARPAPIGIGPRPS